MAILLFPQSDLLDVNQIIKDLASMVAEQGDAIGGYPCYPLSTCPPWPHALPPRCGQAASQTNESQGGSGGLSLCFPLCVPGVPRPSGRLGLGRLLQEGGPPFLLIEESGPPCLPPWAFLPLEDSPG